MGQCSAALKTTGTTSRSFSRLWQWGGSKLGLIALGDTWLYFNTLRDAGWVFLTAVTHLQPPASRLQSPSLCFCLSDVSLSECPRIVCQRGRGINTEMEISQTHFSQSQISGEKLDPVNN